MTDRRCLSARNCSNSGSFHIQCNLPLLQLGVVRAERFQTDCQLLFAGLLARFLLFEIIKLVVKRLLPLEFGGNNISLCFERLQLPGSRFRGSPARFRERFLLCQLPGELSHFGVGEQSTASSLNLIFEGIDIRPEHLLGRIERVEAHHTAYQLLSFFPVGVRAPPAPSDR
jgi:hypothetical protein